MPGRGRLGRSAIWAGSRGVGALQRTAAGQHEEVDGRRGDFDILCARSASAVGNLAGCLMLQQPYVVLAMYGGQNIFPAKIQHSPSGGTLHRLRTGILHADIAGKRGSSQSVLLLRHEQFQLVGLNFRRTWSSDSTRTLPLARMRSTVLSGRKKSVPLSADAFLDAILHRGRIKDNHPRIFVDGPSNGGQACGRGAVERDGRPATAGQAPRYWPNSSARLRNRWPEEY